MKFNTPKELLESEFWANYNADPANQYYKINAQQLAKNPILLDCIEAPVGYSFLQLDFTALEPNVLAEFSGDPCYKDIYASGKPHDVYFYVACKLLDPTGELNETYNLENPTKESVSAAKKKFKKERSTAKVFQLMSTYKAGAAAIHRKLVLAGVDISKVEVQKIRERYWGDELFGQVADYDESLCDEVDQRDGWMMNGMGRPFAITDRKKKDVVNTHTQSTGHDLLDLFVLFFENKLSGKDIDIQPVIEDYHDETIWLVRNDHVGQAKQLLVDALGQLNATVQFGIPLRGEPEVTRTFTEFKGPDPVDWYKEKCSGE